MAKRKLNTPVVIALIASGVLIIGGLTAGYVILRSKNPQQYEAQGDKELAAKSYAAAELSYGIAYKNSDPGSDDQNRRYYKYIQTLLQWAENDPHLTMMERQDKNRRAYSMLRSLLTDDPDNTEARLKLLEMSWPGPNLRAPKYTTYAEEAAKLLQRQPDHPLIQFRYAYVQSLNADINPQHDEKALDEIRKAIKLAPDQPRGYILLAQHHRRMARRTGNEKRIILAEKTYQQAMEKMPENAELLLNYAQFLEDVATIHPEKSRQQAGEASAALYEQAAEKAPDQPAVWLSIGRYHLRNDKVQKGMAAMEKALETDPTYLPAYEQISSVQNTLGRSENALDLLGKGIERMQEDLKKYEQSQWRESQQALRNLDMLRLLKGNIHARLAVSNKDKQANTQTAKELFEAIEYLNPQALQMRYIEARLAWLNNDLAKATSLLDKVFAEVRQSQDPRLALEVGGLLFQTYVAQGAPTKAQTVQEALAEFPQLENSMQVRLMRAAVLEQEGKTEELAQLVEDILRQDPDNTYAQQIQQRLSRGGSDVVRESRTLYNSGRIDEALEVLEQAYSDDKTRLAVLAELVNVLQRLGRTEQLNSLLTTVLQENPEDPQIRDLAAILTETDPQKRLDLQIEMTRRRIDDPVAEQASIARIYLNAGKFDQAEPILQKLQAEHADNPLVATTLYEASLQQEKWDEAVRWARRISQSNPQPRFLLLKPQALISQAVALRNEEPQQAIRAMNDAIVELRSLIEQTVLPEHSNTLLAKSYLLLSDLEPANQQAHLNEADQALDRALEYDRGSKEAIILKVDVSRKKKDRAAFKQWLGRAYEVDPNNLSIRLLWLDNLESTAGSDEMLRQRRKFELESRGRFPSNTLRLARLLEQAGQIPPAAQAYSEYFSRSQDKISAFVVLGRFLRRQGRNADVDRYYESLLKQAQSPEQQLGVKLAFAAVLDETDPDLAFGFLEDLASNQEYRDNPVVLQTLAQENAQRGNWVRAAELLNRAIENTDGPSEPLIRLLSLYHTNAQQHDQALALLEQIPQQSTRDKAFVAILRGQILEQKADRLLGQEHHDMLKKAEAQYTQAVQLNPDDSRALLMRARFYGRTGNSIAAIKDARQAESLSEATDIQITLAELLEKAGQTSSAQSIYRDLLVRRPSREIYQKLLELQLSSQDYRRLEATIEECKKLYPSDPSFELILARSFEVRSQASRTRQEAQQFGQRRLQALQSALQKAPESPVTTTAFAQGLLDFRLYDQALEFIEKTAENEVLASALKPYKAVALAGKGQMDQARELFTESILAADARRIGSLVDMFRRSYGENIAEYAKQAELWIQKREDPALLTAVAGTLASGEAGEQYSQKAREYLEASIKQANDAEVRGRSYIILGQVWYNLGQYQKSRDAYLEGLKILPNDITGLNNLAYIYAENLDSPAQALPFARRAAQLKPGNASILDTYAWTLAQTKQYQDALGYMIQAVRLAEPNSQALLNYHLGYIYENLDQLSAAKRAYDNALAADRVPPDVRANVELGLERLKAKLQSVSNN